MIVLGEIFGRPLFLWVTIFSQLIRELNLIDAFQLAHEAQWAPMLLHLLVVVVEAAYGEIPRLLPRIKNDYALASTSTRSSNFDQLLLCARNELFCIHNEFFVCRRKWLNHTSTPSLLIMEL